MVRETRTQLEGAPFGLPLPCVAENGLLFKEGEEGERRTTKRGPRWTRHPPGPPGSPRQPAPLTGLGDGGAASPGHGKHSPIRTTPRTPRAGAGAAAPQRSPRRRPRRRPRPHVARRRSPPTRPQRPEAPPPETMSNPCLTAPPSHTQLPCLAPPFLDHAPSPKHCGCAEAHPAPPRELGHRPQNTCALQVPAGAGGRVV